VGISRGMHNASAKVWIFSDIWHLGGTKFQMGRLIIAPVVGLLAS